jgi:D-sedoheptulose 7-phosphate isomerase
MFNSYRTDVETAMRGIPNIYVEEAVNILRKARLEGCAVYLVGNGGSAATASHFANDLVKAGHIRAYSIPDIVPLITAYGNDDGWQSIFREPLTRLMLPQDVLISISCSGNSANVVEAARMVWERNIVGDSIALVGADRKCELAQYADVVIDVPFKDIRVQEDCHMAICHAIVGMLRS